MTPDTKMRQEFEAWAASTKDANNLPYFVSFKKDDGSYLEDGCQRVWQAWQASRSTHTGAGAESLARQFHEAYERLAPSFGYETRPETRQFDPASPNGKLMIAVCAAMLAAHQGGK